MSVAVILPTYNERDNLQPVVQKLLGQGSTRIIIVDDNSPDGTGMSAQMLSERFPEQVEVIHRIGSRGFGPACLAGIQRALSTDSRYICQMDADCSHDPADAPRLVSAAHNADLVIGSRYMHGGEVDDWSPGRLLLSWAANAYYRRIAGTAVRDCTSGLRCWRAEALRRLPLNEIQSVGFSFQFEMLWHAVRLGFAVHEIPIRFSQRRAGVSKLGLDTLLEAARIPRQLRGVRQPPSGNGKPRPPVSDGNAACR